MTDDIVARIREQANAGYIDEHEVMLREAADEIERLRTMVVKGYGSTHGETRKAKNEQERKAMRMERYREYQEFCAEARKWLT